MFVSVFLEVVQFQGNQPKGHKGWLALHWEGNWQYVCCYIPFFSFLTLEKLFMCARRPILRPAISSKTQQRRRNRKLSLKSRKTVLYFRGQRSEHLKGLVMGSLSTGTNCSQRCSISAHLNTSILILAIYISHPMMKWETS